MTAIRGPTITKHIYMVFRLTELALTGRHGVLLLKQDDLLTADSEENLPKLQ
jgi:hypothetical protein